MTRNLLSLGLLRNGKVYPSKQLAMQGLVQTATNDGVAKLARYLDPIVGGDPIIRTLVGFYANADEMEKAKKLLWSSHKYDVTEGKNAYGYYLTIGSTIYDSKPKDDFSTKSAQGYSVERIERANSGRYYAILKRPMGDYVVAAGYDIKDGTWAQGYYDYKTYEDLYIDDVAYILTKSLTVPTGYQYRVTCIHYAKKNIFDPIGMENTYFHANEEIYARMASQYRFDKELNRAVDVGKGNPSFGPLFESGGAGAISSTEDYGRFAETLTHMGVAPTGARILSERTVELMRSDCLTDVNRHTFDWPRFRGYGYGYGVRVLKDPGLSGNLTPAGEFGWGGMAGAYVHCEPATQTSIVYMQHMVRNKEDIIHPRLRNMVYAGL